MIIATESFMVDTVLSLLRIGSCVWGKLGAAIDKTDPESTSRLMSGGEGLINRPQGRPAVSTEPGGPTSCNQRDRGTAHPEILETPSDDVSVCCSTWRRD